MYISEIPKNKEGEITVKGWVTNSRSSKGIEFIVLRDGTGYLQCILDINNIGENNYNQAKKLTQESSIELTGTIVENEKQAEGFELQVYRLNVISISEDYPITNKAHGVEFLADNRHLWLRSKRQWAIMRVRNNIIFAIHNFFQKEGFVQADAPIFTANAAEGTSTLFETNYYDSPAYLTQSGQLYGEAMAMALSKIYTFGPTFRAEKSKTRRHLSEFWMIEPEMAFYNNDMNMDLIEKFLQAVIKEVIEKSKKEFEVLERDTTLFEKIIKNDFPRITYNEAVDILKGEKDVNGKNSIKTLENDLQELISKIENIKADITERENVLATQSMKKGKRNFLKNKVDKLKNELKGLEDSAQHIPQWIESAKNFKYGNDLGGSDETVLTRLFELPIMVYNWPHEVKAFYMKRDIDSPELAKGVDLLAPEGYGEVVGGGERETNKELLIEKINEHKLPMEAFEWYLDLRRFGSVPHAGFGLGLERLVAWMCKIKHIRETIPFPRYYGRVTP